MHAAIHTDTCAGRRGLAATAMPQTIHLSIFQNFGDVRECVKLPTVGASVSWLTASPPTLACVTPFLVCAAPVVVDLDTRNTQHFLKSHLYTHCIECGVSNLTRPLATQLKRRMTIEHSLHN